MLHVLQPKRSELPDGRNQTFDAEFLRLLVGRLADTIGIQHQTVACLQVHLCFLVELFLHQSQYDTTC